MTCFVQMLLALLLTRTVNLNKLACVFMSEATQSSSYRRIQRFFAQFKLDYDHLAGFIFRLFFVSGGQWHLTMDRTNWQWGKSNINILTLGIAFKGTAIPIYWMMLDKKGNSDKAERIALVKKFVSQFGKGCIASLLADREFVGKDWFEWLLKEGIGFPIRIKNNTITTDARGLPIDIDALLAIAFCWAHKTGEWRHEKKPIKIKKHGRPAVSLFRYGLDYIVHAIAKVACYTKSFRNCLNLIIPNQALAVSGEPV